MSIAQAETKKSYVLRSTCRLCENSALESVFKLAPTPSGDAYVSRALCAQKQELYPLELMFCKSCALVQLSCTVDPDLLYGNYIYNTSKSLGLIEHFQAYADRAVDFLNTPEGSLVIDIGSNDGTLLKCFKGRNMRVLGIDPAREVAQKAKESAINTIAGYFDSALAARIKQDYSAAGIITANNVFANIDGLPDMIEGIRRLLAQDGVFIFETGYVADMVKNAVMDNIYHEHLSYYGVGPLESFFRNHGMQLFNVERVETKGGSLRGFVQLDSGSRKVSPSVGEFISRENGLGINQRQFYLDFAQKMQAVKDDLQALLKKIKAQGKTVCAYGASVGSTTLICYFELGGILDFLVDDDPKRQDLFTPGLHIPVLPSASLYERKPDYVLILAWRYAGNIKDKHGKFLKQGGKFIVPLPQVQADYV